MAQQTAVNGVRYDFTTLTLEGSTAPNFGSVGFQFPKGIIQSITMDGTQDAGIVQGNQIFMLGRTNGYGIGTGTMELLVSESDDFDATITNQGQVPVMSVFFDLRVAYSVNGTDVRTLVGQGIKITKVTMPNQKGNDATMATYELSIAKVYKNGILLFGDPANP